MRMMSGIGSQDGPQRRRERQAGLRVRLHLVDAGDAVLDRVLDRDDVDLGPRDGVQRRVERGGLARAGGTADDQHAVGTLVGGAPLHQVLRREAQVGQRHLRRRVVEDPHDDLLAPHGRQAADAQVDLAPPGSDREPAVLREAPLGDVHVAHDLQSGDDRRLHLLGCRRHLLQHAVDAEADADIALARLDVDVRCVVRDRLVEQQVDVPHERRVRRRGDRARGCRWPARPRACP